jgi:hypothetical protein
MFASNSRISFVLLNSWVGKTSNAACKPQGDAYIGNSLELRQVEPLPHKSNHCHIRTITYVYRLNSAR